MSSLIKHKKAVLHENLVEPKKDIALKDDKISEEKR